MKKRILLIIFTCIYAIAVAAGFLYAKVRSASAEPVSTPMPFQSNWVLVRIDDMTSETPHLVSVWVMLSSFSSAPQVFFKPIFSSESKNSPTSELARKFAVNQDRALNSQFLAELNKLNIQRSGLVILDDEGFRNFTAWFNPPASNRQISGVSPVLLHTTSFSNSEAQSYLRICAVLQAEKRGQPVILRWQDLPPNHFILHPNLDPFVNLWNRLLSSTTAANCTVIPGP
jgi:hypothetical protein